MVWVFSVECTRRIGQRGQLGQATITLYTKVAMGTQRRQPWSRKRGATQPLVYGAWVIQFVERPCLLVQSLTGPLTGKPDAGDPPVRFGGRDDVRLVVPTPIGLLRSADGPRPQRPGVRGGPG